MAKMDAPHIGWWQALFGLVAIQVVGLWTASDQPDLWFSRWGSVVVVYAVVLFSLGRLTLSNYERFVVESRVQSNEQFIRQMARIYRVDELKAKPSSELSDFEIESLQMFSNLKEEWEPKGQSMRSEVRDRADSILFLELLILVLGTLQWGFGDLFFQALMTVG